MPAMLAATIETGQSCMLPPCDTIADACRPYLARMKAKRFNKACFFVCLLDLERQSRSLRSEEHLDSMHALPVGICQPRACMLHHATEL